MGLPHRPSDDGYPVPANAGVVASMRSNRRRDSTAELEIRRLLHARGFRYRVDHRVEGGGIKTRGDVVFTRRRVVVFIDGCFWHGCPAHGRSPHNNAGYWRAKLSRNQKRDLQVTTGLASAGWRVLRFWGHEAPTAVVDAIARALS